MNKNQIFNLIVEKTASVCGVTAEQIKSNNRRADIVDARCIAFCYATQEGGFTPRDIATLLGKDNPKAIRALCQSFDTRHARSYCFRELSASLRSEIRGEGYFQPSNKVTEKRP